MTAVLDFTHAHSEECDAPCQRCLHLVCEHHDYIEPGRFGFAYDDECTVPGCDCPQWLAYSDCPGESEYGPVTYHCNGNGGWWIESPDGRREDWFVCGNCNGTGVYYPPNPVAS